MDALQVIAAFAIVLFGGVALVRGSSVSMFMAVLLAGVCVGLILRCADGR
jgi:hypothetical protein